MNHRVFLALLLLLPFPLHAANVLSVAVFDFESRDEPIRDLGPKIATLLNAQLSANPDLITVERAELDKALGEQELGLSGTIQPETAAKVGHLTGAQVLITGRAFLVDRQLMIVAKIIGTETSRVYGEVADGPGINAAANMTKELAGKVSRTIAAKADTLVAKVETPQDRIEKIKKTLGDKKRPVVEVHIAERHFGTPTIDPAAETELGFILQKCGFTVLGSDPAQKPDLSFQGEAFSEFGMRKGNLVSCKGRVELKVKDRVTGQLIVIDRQTAIAVDLSEQMAGKAAIQKAAQQLAERVVPQTVDGR